MKCLLYLTSAAVTFFASVDLLHGQTIFTYGSKQVSQKEFLKAFDKNPTTTNRQQAMKDYLTLYQHYKLKVQDAYDKKMDTLEGQQQELFAYQEQLTESFIAKQSNIDGLVKEAFDRSQKDLYISHLAIPFSPGDTASERLAATASFDAWNQLKKGTSFSTIISKYSKDEAAKASNGLVGWVTVFTLPYKYENAIYNTAVGGYTEPVKGTDAFHLFYIQQQRKAVGKVKVAQILLWQMQDGAKAEDARVSKLADSVFHLVVNGMPFDQAALQFSTDRSSFSVGGELPEFGVGTYDEIFENTSFGLQKNGEIAKPIKTSYGWHIIKLLSKTPVSTNMDDDQAMAALKQQVVASERMEMAEKAFLKKNLEKMKFVLASFSKPDLWRFTDSSLRNGNISQSKIKPGTLLFSVGTEKIFAENWVMYNRAAGTVTNAEYEGRWESYIMQSANTYYKQHIADFEPLYNEQLKEFKDANLLFAAMEKNVWSEAASDSLGLRKYYEANKQQYKWGDGATAIMITATDSLAALSFSNKLAAKPQQWRILADEFKQTIIADSGRFELNQLPIQNDKEATVNAATSLVRNPMDNSFSFAFIISKLPGGDSRSFEDAKGWVIGDYQHVLEERWLLQLKKKYPIKVNESVWQQTLKVN